jgi:hypothetical protein
MKIKFLSLVVLLVAALGLSGCYDVYPGGYGYGGAPGYAGRYYPAGGWGNWGGWGYPGYYGHDYWNHDFLVPEHRGFIAHNFGAPMDGHGLVVAHNGFHGGGAYGGGAARGWHGGGDGFHGAARGGGGYHGGGSHGER